jgi:hypothetical protein
MCADFFVFSIYSHTRMAATRRLQKELVDIR